MATTTATEQVTSNIPEWAKPFASQLFGRTFGGKDPITGQVYPGLLDQPYRQYEGQMVAGFNPLQQAAFSDLAAMGISPQTLEASGLASLVGRRAGELGQYQAYQPQQFYQAPTDRVGAERFGLGAMQEYMSPYMQGVVEQQKRRAIQDYARQIPGLQAAGIRAGARGGTREAILQSEAQRNLQEQLGGIQATGLQNAYQQAAQQFGADRAAQMQAAMANQQAALQSAGLGAQYGLAGAQMGEASRQFGAGLGMQGLGQQLAAAGALGGLGQQQYQQGLGISQAQLGAGQQIQGAEQQQLQAQYQDFLNRMQFPYRQLEFASGILRGFQPTGQTTTLYQPSGSTFGGMLGTGAGLAGLFGALGG